MTGALHLRRTVYWPEAKETQATRARGRSVEIVAAVKVLVLPALRANSWAIWSDSALVCCFAPSP